VEEEAGWRWRKRRGWSMIRAWTWVEGGIE